jgi:hypothetical protein
LRDLLHGVIHLAAGTYYYGDYLLVEAARNLGKISPDEFSKVDPNNKNISASAAWDRVLKNRCLPPQIP